MNKPQHSSLLWMYLLRFFIVSTVILLIFYHHGLLDTTPFQHRHVDITALLKLPIYKALGYALLTGIIATIVAYQNSKKSLEKARDIIKNALKERHLEHHLSNLHHSNTWGSWLDNTDSTFKLFRSFDALKAAKISELSTSFKSLVSLMDKGLIVLNQDHVVTGINPEGESLLKLRPGEILSQHISRKVSNETVLDAIRAAIEDGQKTPPTRTKMKGTLSCSFSVTPVKNKFGDVMRVLLVIDPVSTRKPKTTTKGSQPL